jgi:MscS family membrane protein
MLSSEPAHARNRTPPPLSAPQPKPAQPNPAEPQGATNANQVEEPPPEEPTAPDSPRASVSHFLAFVRKDDYQDAAQYLDVPKAREGEGPTLARRLIAVLDRYSWIDVERLSPDPQGALDDGLPPNFEQIGSVPGPLGMHEPVRLTRRGADKNAKWVFSRATVEKIDSWYDRLEDRWFLEHLPAPLLRVGPRNLLWWQWIALPLLLVGAGVLGTLVSWIVRRILGKVATRTPTPWLDGILQRLKSPMALAWALVIGYAAVPLLALYQPAEDFVHRLLRGGFLFAFFWGLARLVDVSIQVLLASPWGRQRRTSSGLIGLLGRLGKIVVVTIAVVAFLSELGYPVTSLVAGLGIGGLAVALAAQKTVENLFGTFSISADQPFREGDFVRVDGILGTVELIGLRSTRIRTPDRTIVTMPNGKLADMRIESFARRDRIQFTTTIALALETTTEQLEDVIEGLERLVRGHPKVWHDGTVVSFLAITDSSLNIEMACLFQTSDWAEFVRIRQNLLLDVMRLVERAGTTFARPTRSVQLTEGALASYRPSMIAPRGNGRGS